MPTTVTVLPPSQDQAPGINWSPVVGPQGDGVPRRAARLSDEARGRVIRAAWEALGRGIDPDGQPAQETGLVVGYVQSGKTLSFTTVIGLARDNKFPLVIVVVGTKTNLHTQSAERLERDLGADSGDGPRVVGRWGQASRGSFTPRIRCTTMTSTTTTEPHTRPHRAEVRVSTSHPTTGPAACSTGSTRWCWRS